MRVSRNVQWGEMQGMQKVETVEQMPDEYRDVLTKIIYALASTEFASVEQHQPWINQGPTPEDRYIQAQITADEAHQGRRRSIRAWPWRRCCFWASMPAIRRLSSGRSSRPVRLVQAVPARPCGSSDPRPP